MQGHVWQLRSEKLQWQHRPLLLGILNITPDSFSDGGQYLDPEVALDRALEMEAEGADLIDIGGESSRPGAEMISAEVELSRVLPVVKRLYGHLRIPISVDTWKADVARAVLEAGAEVINDISAGRWDLKLWPVVASFHAGYILMHAPGLTPQTRHEFSTYPAIDPVLDIRDFLARFLARAEENGLALNTIVCDPGFGFAKTQELNLSLLNRLQIFDALQRPLLVGLSRKSFLKRIGGAEQMEISSLIAHTWASAREPPFGASMMSSPRTGPLV